MISIQLERHIVAILDLADRQLSVDETITELRRHGHFPAPDGNLDPVRDAIRIFLIGYFIDRLEAGDRHATDFSPD